MQTELWPSMVSTWGTPRGYTERVALAGKDCPVNGDVARQQWLQKAFDSAVRIHEIMAKKDSNNGKVAERVTNVKWVNYKLLKEDKAQFDAWQPELSELSDSLLVLVTDGYRLSFAWDKFNKSAMCSVVCQMPDDPNFGKGFSTYAHTWDKLIALVVFKHFVVFQRVWPDVGAQANDEEYG